MTSGRAGRLPRTSRDLYLKSLDQAVGLQERNVRLAQELAQSSIRGLRRQSERNWEMVQELFERTEKQSQAFLTLIEESMSVYPVFPYAPLSHHERETASKVTTR